MQVKSFSYSNIHIKHQSGKNQEQCDLCGFEITVAWSMVPDDRFKYFRNCGSSGIFTPQQSRKDYSECCKHQKSSNAWWSCGLKHLVDGRDQRRIWPDWFRLTGSLTTSLEVRDLKPYNCVKELQESKSSRSSSYFPYLFTIRVPQGSVHGPLLLSLYIKSQG